MSDYVFGAASDRDHLAPDVWTIGRILQWSKSFLAEKGIAAPRLDAELLLAHAMGCDRIQLYTRFEQPLSQEERQVYRGMLQRRSLGEPVAYILGVKGFFGRDFHVDRRVLVPRPETEGLVERVLSWIGKNGLKRPRILDVGTGSGCLAVTLASELSEAEVDAWDVSADALAVAQENACRLGVAERVQLRRVDARRRDSWQAQPLYDVVVSNPPYIALEQKASLMRDVKDFEPEVALFAAHDGLEFYQVYAAMVPRVLKQPGLFLCEFGWAQADLLRDLFSNQGVDLKIENDYAGTPRYLMSESLVLSE